MFNSMSMPEFDEYYRKNDTINLIDVREVDEYESGHIPIAKNMPLSEFPVELDKEKTYYVICQSGGRSTTACQYLANNGYDVVNVMGGMSAWKGDTE
ncbi:rhodanese-like domain-containing protein [Alkalibacterium sp. MB6]|uniref:rhodanese-like domain-containing protein n=1 Tax=Alkalibacterium sp. MB6 TaxID=2081965 RepID=UPI00137989F6|nr:rhodanese-like domain-containing protein [Alkalibacterium sp. MB6]